MPSKTLQILVDMNPVLFPVGLHFLPIFGDFAMRLSYFIPRHGSLAGGLFHHADAAIHRANIEAQAAADAILLANLNLGTRPDSLFLPVGANVVAARWHDASIFGDQVNTLVRGVIARHITEIAADAFLLVDTCHGLEGK